MTQDEIASAYAAGDTMTTIRERTGRSLAYIHRCVKRKVSARPRGPRRHLTNEQCDYLYGIRHDPCRESARVYAERFNVCVDTIYRCWRSR